MTRVRDENAIESILSNAMSSGDPSVLQNSIGQILSQVSPERQQTAVQYLQNTLSGIESRAKQGRERAAAQQAGLNPDLPESLQKIQYEEMANDRRFQNIAGNNGGFGQMPQSPGQAPQSLGQGQPMNSSLGISSGEIPVQPDQNRGQIKQSSGQTFGIPAPASQSIETGLRALSDDQLVQLTGVKGYSEPAKQELRRRQEDRKLEESKSSAVFKSDLDRANKFKDKVSTAAETIPQKETALKLMDEAILNKDLGFLTYDNLADITGIEGLRTPEGALFKTASKEYFLGNISRAGSRPNQWVEQQIQDMMAKIGRSTAANLSVSRALKNELDLDKEKVRLTEEVSDRLRASGDVSEAKLESMVNKDLRSYAEKKQKELFNDLRAIKAIDDNSPQKFMPVEKGTPISKVVAQAILKQSGNDPKKAANEATKLGYFFE